MTIDFEVIKAAVSEAQQEYDEIAGAAEELAIKTGELDSAKGEVSRLQGEVAEAASNKNVETAQAIEALEGIVSSLQDAITELRGA